MLGLHSLSSYLHSVKRMIFCSGEKNIQWWIMNMKQNSTSCKDFCSKLVLPAFKHVGWDQLPTDDDNQKKLRSTVLSAVAKILLQGPKKLAKSFQSCMKLHFFPSICQKRHDNACWEHCSIEISFEKGKRRFQISDLWSWAFLDPSPSPGPHHLGRSCEEM